LPQRAAVPPDAAVLGGMVLSTLAAMGPFRRRGEQALAERGIVDVDVERWYPLSAYLEALDSIGERMGPNTLFQVGRQVPNHVALPPGLDSFPAVLGAYGAVYDSGHRGVPGGVVTHETLSDRSGRIISATPYPCDLDRGVIVGLFQHLLGVRVIIESYEECRKDGGGCCTYIIALPVE